MFGSQNFQGLKNEESVRWYKSLSPFLYIHTTFKYLYDTDYTGLHFLKSLLDKNAVLLPSHWFRLKWIKRDAKCLPHENINQCLTNINQCLTNIFKIEPILTDI